MSRATHHGKGAFLLFLALLLGITGSPRKLLGQDSEAQEDEQVATLRSYKPSPEAASLAKVVDVPVNLQTGRIRFSKTLYTIESKSLELPIKLSYNGQAVKAADLPSWVGLGWSLSVGGTITRSVRGNPDEGAFNPDRPGYAKRGDALITEYFAGHGEEEGQARENLHNPGFQLKAKVNSSKNNLNEKSPDLRNSYDFGPDQFTYNFAGRSGNFIVGIAPDDVSSNHFANAPIFTIPRKDLKIKPSTGAKEWSVWTKDGTKYVFGKQESTEYFDPGNKFPSSWYLTKIKSPKGDGLISIDYTDGYFMRHNMTAKEFALTKKIDEENMCTVRDNKTSSETYRDKSQEKVYVKQIKTNEKTIDFISSERKGISDGSKNFKKLEKILIKEDTEEGPITLKTIDFQYGYFMADTSEAPDDAPVESPYRLRLDKVVINGADGSERVPYSFDYYSGQLPSRYSTDLDYWGFPNGQDNSTLIPKANPLNPPILTNGATFSGFLAAERTLTSSVGTLLPGMLKRVTYPTGGTTTFEYEQNSYGWTTASRDTTDWGGDGVYLRAGPGLRIKRIEKRDGNASTPAKVRRFDYTMKGTTKSSGMLVTKPRRFFRDDGVWAAVGKSAVPVGRNKGTYVNYRQVAVLHGPDGSNGKPIGGTTRYEFTTSLMTLKRGYRDIEKSFGGLGTDEMPPAAILPLGMQRLKSWEYGLQTSRQSRAAGGTLKRRRETSHVLSGTESDQPELLSSDAETEEDVRFRRFPVLMKKSFYSTQWNYTEGFNCLNFDGFDWLGWSEATTAFSAPDSVTVTRYDSDGTVTLRTTTDYDYQDGDHFQLRSKTKATSNGRSRTTRYKYAYENHAPDMGGAVENGEDHMLSQKYRTTVFEDANKNGSVDYDEMIWRRTWTEWMPNPETSDHWVRKREWVWTPNESN